MSNDFLKQQFNLDKIDKSWEVFFNQQSNFFLFLKQINDEYEKFVCFPQREEVFRLFFLVSWEKIKVVIIGQDPYHTPGVADGLAFSTRKKNYLPPSLKNIFQELKEDIKCELPKSGDLSGWLLEGIFLLNVALSVRSGKALSHLHFWSFFVDNLICFLKKKNNKLVWVFWGKFAYQIKEKNNINSQQSVVGSHPSPFSASSGFFGSHPFSKINKILSELGVSVIKWEKLTR